MAKSLFSVENYSSKHIIDVGSVICMLKFHFSYAAPSVASSPVKAPAHQFAASSSPSASGRGKHSNLILILSIGAGIVIISIISMLIICSCAFCEGKPEGSPKRTGMYD